ncbi:MAG: FecR domain-containing protein [Saprospiraceae bacterium]|nr:FecR domain-containing protein [Saprospiraceae bacterium]
MKEQDFQIRVIRFLSGELSPDEGDHLLESISKSAEKQKFFEDYRKTWEKSETTISIPETDIDDQWQKFEDRAFRDLPSGKVTPMWSRPLFKIAVMVAILASTIITWGILTTDGVEGGNPVVLQTSMEVQEFDLPDGSTIWLNKNSRVEYAADFKPRTVFLEGEALFEVQHLPTDASFTVETRETKVTVLGTVFMVNSSPDEGPVTVFVQEGKVAFEKLEGRESTKILGAGEQAVYDHQEETVRKLEQAEENLLSWKTGSFTFNDAVIGEILPTLEKHFGVQFQVNNSDLLNCTYNSKFSNMNLNEMLEELSFGLNLEIRQVQNGIYEVDGMPCK